MCIVTTATPSIMNTTPLFKYPVSFPDPIYAAAVDYITTTQKHIRLGTILESMQPSKIRSN